MISRTDGFKGIVRQQLEVITGIPVAIDQVGADPAFNLVILGVTEAAATNRPSRFTIGKAELKWRMQSLFRDGGWPFRYLMIKDCTVQFAKDKAGQWSPAPALASAFAPWVETGVEFDARSTAGSHITEFLRQNKARLDARNVNAAWFASPTNDLPLFSVSGLDLSTDPVQPLDGNVLWCTMTVQHVGSGESTLLRDLSIEWIRQADQDVVLRVTGLDPAPVTLSP